MEGGMRYILDAMLVWACFYHFSIISFMTDVEIDLF